ALAEAQTWSVTGSLNQPRAGHTAALLSSGKVLIAGGGDVSVPGTLQAELYDPVTGIWSVTGAPLPKLRKHTMTALQNGKVLLAGGSTGLNILGTAILYDPSSGAWTNTGSMIVPRDQH